MSSEVDRLARTDLGMTLGSTEGGPTDDVQGPTRGFLRRLLTRPGPAVAAAFLLTLCAIAALAPYLRWLDPNGVHLENVLAPPSVGHWLGYDSIGRDVFSRLVDASRVSLVASATAVLVALLIGLPLGLIAGYARGAVDLITSRIIEGLMGFPPLLLAIVIVSLLRPGLISAMVAIGVVVSPVFFRVIRASALNVSGETYIEAAHVSGAGPLRTIIRHVLPNIRGPLLIQVALTMSTAIVVEAALSFIGLGVQSPQASWGSMLRQASADLGNAPVTYMLSPAVTIIAVVLAFNALADGLRNSFGARAVR